MWRLGRVRSAYHPIRPDDQWGATCSIVTELVPGEGGSPGDSLSRNQFLGATAAGGQEI